MLRDAFPPALAGTPLTPQALGAAVAALACRGSEALADVGPAALLAAWAETVEAFLDPGSPERRALAPALARRCRLSPAGLAAGLAAVLGGVREAPATALFDRARGLPPGSRGAVLAVLAGNLPALAVQPLLPALALGRPVFLKSPSTEPFFAPAFLAALTRREPRLGAAVAAAAWPGGDTALEAPVLAGVETVLAYGGLAALDDLERRASGKLVRYGPKTSLALVGKEVDPAAVAPGLARDVALFDQRGCLSIAAVYTAGDPEELAARLAAALGELARQWPPGPAETAAAAAVQQLRATAEMRGRTVLFPGRALGQGLGAGTVIVEPEPAFHPSPGLRTVRVHPLPDLAAIPAILAPWQGRLQGAALAGADAWGLAGNFAGLASLGISRTAAPGELQSPDAAWHNGGVDPLAVLAGFAGFTAGPAR
jgi:hypothetical protein